jgi:hypothetical protein
MAKKQIIDIDAEFDGLEFDEVQINRVTGNINRSKTAEWKSAIKEKNIAQSKDPEYLESLRKGIKTAWENPELREKHSKRMSEQHKDKNYTDAIKKGIKKAWENPELREKKAEQNRIQSKDPEYLKALHKGIEKRDQGDWYEKNARKNTLTKSKPIVTPFGVFPSRIVAVKTLTDVTNIGGKINKGIKEKDSGYYYITQEEYTILTGKEI